MIVIKFVPRGGGGILALLLLVMGIVVSVEQCKEADTMRPALSGAFSVPPPAVMWHNDSGAKYLEKGNYSKAIEKFTKSIEILPSAAILNFRAAAYYGLGNFNSAIAD
jgi:tetratricopeptide (TPR) repeat protein